MKKLLSIIVLFMCVMRVAAADVNLSTAQATAVSFLQSQTRGNLLAGVPASSVKLLHAEANSTLVEKSVYYIFNADRSFVIVPGDDRAPQILAYGDRPLDMNSMPDNMRFWLEGYKEQIEYLQAHPGMVVDKPMLRQTQSVAPLITATWAQQVPYYNQCPVYDGKYCVTGCPATSLAMVFHHWKYPTGPTPPVEGYTNQANKYEFEIPALPSITFDWDNMLDQYVDSSYTTVQADAVAWLMRYIGQVEQLQYTPSGTGGKGEDVIRAVQFFGYDEDMGELVYKSKMDVNKNDSLLIEDDEWHAMLQNELINGRPVVYCGYHREWIGWYGHAFNVDGYNAATGTYHVKWGGASGDGDGYFYLNSFIPPFGTNYNVEQQMIMGILPPPSAPAIKAHRDLVYLNAVAGHTVTSTFTVKGVELTSDVTLTLNDDSGFFSLDATTVPAAELDNGKNITVTYSPDTNGYHTATVTLSSPGVDDKTVVIIGKAVLDKENPFLLPPDSSCINLTEFRADWIDETPDENVDSYTLRVYTRPETELIDYIDNEDYPTQYAAAITLTQPWSGVNVSVGGKAVYFANWEGVTGFDGYIAYTIPYGFDEQVFSVTIKTVSWSSNFGDGILTVGSDQTQAVEYEFTPGEAHTWLVTAKSGETIIIDSPDWGHSPYMDIIEIYAGDVTQSGTTGTNNGITRLIPGITDKYYTVTDLPAEGTYVYKVKALYVDGTESSWSNRQTVTLFENGHSYELGDVNHDGIVSIIDVTYLIDYLLGSDTPICETCADVNGDSGISIIDATALIDKLLSTN